MEPLYFNPLDNTGNFIGTNPLTPTDVPVKTSFYPYFNPSIYQSFTFYSFPVQTAGSAATFLGASFGDENSEGYLYFSALSAVITDEYEYITYMYYSTVFTSHLQFSTFNTFYATYLQLNSVTYSIRFGTELQTLYGSAAGTIGTSYTYAGGVADAYLYYSDVVNTYNQSGDLIGENQLTPLEIQFLYQEVVDETLVGSNTAEGEFNGNYVVGSSTFVNLMGSNVYLGLIDTTNSIIIYQNEQVSSYYSQSLSYQVNIANLTAALNSVSSGSGSDESGNGTITITFFSWTWLTTTQGWTGSQLTGPNYLSTATVNTYLSVTYGGTVITNSSVAVTQVQSLITVQNNDLANSQTFMNNAVTTLQSQVSLAGQIIGTLSSIMQSIIGNI